MNQIPDKILICAGEASGDLHASAVIRAMLQENSTFSFFGVAGPAMTQAGCHVIHQMDELNVMGIGDVIRALPRIHRVEASLCQWAEENKPALAILVDFPGFNMRLGRKLKAKGIPVLHYIAPKLWAWGAWRAKKLRLSQDRLASILPFEIEWFKKHEIEASYVGNPSAVACRGGWSRQQLKSHLGIEKGDRLLALLPGSRPGEVSRHVSLLSEAYLEIRKKYPDLKAVTSRAPGVTDDQLMPLIRAGAKVVDRMESGYALRADAAIAVSGTATLELALWDVPSVLIYRSSPVTVWMARKLVQTECAGLANILLGDKPVMPELIQECATVENIIGELSQILDGPASLVQRNKFAELRSILGDQNPSDGVSGLAMELISLR
ncbi:MAG: lipid-A-disaccharide synthase [Mariprofundaceae bacterium]|nr:lipid-A-disaccharide synthase [Mariprofundaceae bacterium]